jgi:hypothetical protein
MYEKTFRQPAALFLIAAGLLAINGVIFFHSDWPPRYWPKITFTLNDFGEALLFCAAIFAGIGLLYLGLTRLLRLPMKPVLGYAHFAMSSAAILVGMFLDYWFNITYKAIPGEGFISAASRGLGKAFEGSLWAMGIFATAQLVFLFNLSRSVILHFQARRA